MSDETIEVDSIEALKALPWTTAKIVVRGRPATGDDLGRFLTDEEVAEWARTGNPPDIVNDLLRPPNPTPE